MDPRLRNLEGHFHWEGALLVGDTPTGRATVRCLVRSESFHGSLGAVAGQVLRARLGRPISPSAAKLIPKRQIHHGSCLGRYGNPETIPLQAVALEGRRHLDGSWRRGVITGVSASAPLGQGHHACECRS